MNPQPSKPEPEPEPVDLTRYDAFHAAAAGRGLSSRLYAEAFGDAYPVERIPEFFPTASEPDAGRELEAKVRRHEERGLWDRLNDLWEAHEAELRAEDGDLAADAKLTEARNHRPGRPYRETFIFTVRAGGAIESPR